MQRKANRAKNAINFIDGITRHLRHPLFSRMSGEASDGDASSLEMQEEQDIISLQWSLEDPLVCSWLGGTVL